MQKKFKKKYLKTDIHNKKAYLIVKLLAFKTELLMFCKPHIYSIPHDTQKANLYINSCYKHLIIRNISLLIEIDDLQSFEVLNNIPQSIWFASSKVTKVTSYFDQIKISQKNFVKHTSNKITKKLIKINL